MSNSAAPPRPDAPSPAYTYYVLAVLFVVYVLNFADRRVLSILIPSIKNEFAISDTLIGLLTGPAFAFFYTVLGVPIARWADRGSRRTVIMFSSCLGVSLGGWVTNRFGARDARWYMRLPALYSILAWSLAVGFLVAPDRTTAIACFVPFYAIANMYVGPLWSTAQNLSRPNQRATASAVLLFILNISGLGLGPFLIDVSNDLLASQYAGLAVRYSLLGVVTLSMAACIPFWIGSKNLREELAAA